MSQCSRCVEARGQALGDGDGGGGGGVGGGGGGGGAGQGATRVTGGKIGVGRGTREPGARGWAKCAGAGGGVDVTLGLT
jgi:hypothetical protein